MPAGSLQNQRGKRKPAQMPAGSFTQSLWADVTPVSVIFTMIKTIAKETKNQYWARRLAKLTNYVVAWSSARG